MRFPFTIRVARRVGILVVGMAFLTVAQTSTAQAPFRWEKTRDATLLSAGVLLGAGSLVLLAGVDPLTIDEIDRLDANDVNDFDRDSIVPFSDAQTGDAMAVVSYLLPLTTLVREDTNRDWKTIGVMWVEATLLNLGINGVVKSTLLRTRPYAYDPETPLDKKTTSSARLSFYSGHTASAACNCFFVARVLSAYVESPKARVAMWAGAATYPALTGLLRVDSGHHFRTDIITGYVIGAAVGYLVPQLHRIGDDRVSLRPAAVGGSTGLEVQIAF
ncbi:MAG TPA: phosphatase PAP2 family protein [Candidatus Krumholzibacteria bacterium]|nr:phosphatase PAP2 family protein [Candidatus Krumholzibacteria bacterium]